MAKFDLGEGLFMSPEEVQAKQREDITATLKSDPALGRGMLVGSSLARLAGGKSQEEVAAMANQRAMQGMEQNPESIRMAATKMREAGNVRGAMVLEDRAFQIEQRMQQTAAHELSMRVQEDQLLTQQLSRKHLNAQMQASAAAVKAAAAEKARGVEMLKGMQRGDLAGFVEAGMDISKAFELANAKTKPIKVKAGEGREVLLDPTTYETLWEPSVDSMFAPKYNILPKEEVDALGASQGVDLSGAIIERNNETGKTTFIKSPTKPPQGLRDEYNITYNAEGQEVWTPKQGTPAWEEAQERKRKLEAQREEGIALSRKVHADVTNAMNVADDALTLLTDSRLVGGVGSVLSILPATDAADFEAKIDTLKGGKSLEAYRAAKEAGVTFGSTTQAEWDLLARQSQNLDAKQSRPQLKAQLEAFQAQQMNALIALVDEIPPEELKVIGLGNLEYLRGKPRVTADTYSQAKGFFDAKNKVAENARKEENAWALEQAPAAPKQQSQIELWSAELDAMEGE